MSRLVDISVALHPGTLVYPGDPVFGEEKRTDLNAGDQYTSTHISMSVHCGTHIDAPAHFIAGGKGISEYPPERFLLKAFVVDCADESIHPDDIPRNDLAPGMAVLFRTSNSRLLRKGAIPDAPCFISRAAAEKLVELKIGLVGIDWLSVESGEGGMYPVHGILLSNDILILETILLDEAAPGPCFLHALPLAFLNTEASPVRAVLEY